MAGSFRVPARADLDSQVLLWEEIPQVLTGVE
jgi:hypothetical protein